MNNLKQVFNNKNSQFISKNYAYAVVGASQDKSKYGHRVYRDLVQDGYEVYPVNPKGGNLLGNKVYPTLKEIPADIDVIVMVVPPEVAQKILVQAKALGIQKIWFQPGSENQEVLDFCKEHNLNCQTQACIMMERR